MKERLIGAAVLIALGVWLIPWVLDGSDEPLRSGANSLQLPAAEEPVAMRSQTLKLRGPDTPEPAAPLAPVDAPQNSSSLAALARNAAAAVVAAVKPDSNAEAPAAVAPEPAPVTSPEPAPVTSPEPAPVTSPEPAEPANTTVAQVLAAPLAVTGPAKAAATPPPDAPPAPRAAAEEQPRSLAAVAGAGKGDWVVQLGSFGEEANARRLADRARTLGYKPDVAPFRAGGRTLYRVRVGQAATRGQAEATASALVAHGFPAQVVTAN